MKTLALETSAKSVSVAVTEDGKVLASSYQNIGLTHRCRCWTGCCKTRG